jgi:hypothetical protein
MTDTEANELAKKLAFQDQEFLTRLREKTVQVLRTNLRTLELIETPKAVIAEALVLLTASRIESDLSREHAVAFLKKLTAELEKTTAAVTVQ